MIKYSKSRMQVWLTKAIPFTTYNVKVTGKDGMHYTRTFVYRRYHEKRLLERAQRMTIRLLKEAQPEFGSYTIKTDVVKKSITVKSNKLSIPKGYGVTKWNGNYYLYSPTDIRQYRIKTVDISSNPPAINEKEIVINGKYRKEREHIKIEKAISENEKLISFKLIQRITKKLEKEVKFAWPQDDKI